MAKMVFKINGGGDMSVGIPDTHATVTIESDYKEVNKIQLELFREFLREFYDMPMGAVLTLEEYEKQEEQERDSFEDMRTDYDKEREAELTHLNYIAERTQATQE